MQKANEREERGGSKGRDKGEIGNETELNQENKVGKGVQRGQKDSDWGAFRRLFLANSGHTYSLFRQRER